MNKIIVADSQAIFRAGIAKVLAMEDGFHIIAQCSDVERMTHAIATFPGAVVLFASTLRPDVGRLLKTLEKAGSRAIVIAENNESAGTYLRQGFRGVVLRNATAQSLVECVRRVANGGTWVQPQLAVVEEAEDMVGTRVLHRLTPKEMRILALIVKGWKNREIAVRLKTTEQVVKNYLHSIFDKSGVHDRLELALFTVHHRVLEEMAAEMGNTLQAEEQQAVNNAIAPPTEN